MATSYVGISEISVPVEGAASLRRAFDERLGAVDHWPGFVSLELLQDRKQPGRYLMITRWATREEFLNYMRSEDHRRSHDRIERGPLRPRPAGFSENDQVAR